MKSLYYDLIKGNSLWGIKICESEYFNQFVDIYREQSSYVKVPKIPINKHAVPGTK